MDRRKPDVKPTEAFPKIIWYQVKQTKPSEEEQQIIYNNHYHRIVELLKKKYPTANLKDIEEAAEPMAREDADREINKPTRLEKTVTNNLDHYYKMIRVIENSDNFIKWYEK